MPVRRYLKRRLQDLMMFFEGLLRLILYLGPQRAVEHEYEEGKFQQEPIISLMVEPFLSDLKNRDRQKVPDLENRISNLSNS